MNIGMNGTCYLCHLSKQIETARAMGTDKQVTAFTRELMQAYVEAPKEASAPWFTPVAEGLLQKYFDAPKDRYRSEKEMSNRFVLERLDAIRDIARTAEDPVYAGLQLALLGNYLDFDALGENVSFEQLEEILSQVAGAGRVKVLLTVEEGAWTRYQTDSDTQNAGDSRSVRVDTVIVTDRERAQSGLVTQVNPPVYLGAVVVCQGAESAAVRLAITEAVSDATGLTSDKISVLKMK
jgi:uncharacterized protein with ATP-grasp and redox domains